MIDAGLNIKVGADVSGAIAGFKKVNDSLDVSKLSLEDAQKKLDVFYNAINRTSDPALITGYEKSIASLENRIGQLQDQALATANSIKTLNEAESSLSSSSESASLGITKSRVAFQDLGRVITGEGFSLRSISSNFILFGPVVTVAAAALGYFIEKVLLAKDANEKLNETLGAGSASVQGQIAELKDLGAIALDNTNSTKDRQAAFAKLQDLYPGYLGNLSLERDGYAKIQIALDQVTAALIRQAQIKGLEGAITDIYKELNKTVAEGGTTLEKFGAVAVGVFNVFSGGATKIKEVFQSGQKGSIAAQLASDSKTAQDQVDILNTKLQELLKTSLGDKLETPKTNKTVQDENISYLEKVKSLTEGLSKEDKNPLFKDFAESASGALGAVNFKIYQDNLKKATDAAAKGAITPETFALYADALEKALHKQQNPDLTIHIPFELEEEPGNEFETTEEIDKHISKIAHEIKPIHLNLTIGGFDQLEAAEIEKTAKKIADSFNKTLNQALESGIEAIGQAVGKGSIGNLFSDIEGIIGSGLESLGQSLLEAYPIINLAKTAIENAIYDPELIAVAGALAIGAGAVIKGLASKSGIHAFAEGGIVTAPTLGLVGEAGPEAIIPLSKWNTIVNNTVGGSGAMTVNVRGQLSGNTLNLLSARANKNQALV